MRKPEYLSPSSLSLWAKDREEFYLRYLAETKAPRLPQERYMSIGSAFDAYAKSALHELLFGRGADPAFLFDTIFVQQVETQHRDWAREHGRYVFDCYRFSGAFDDLADLLHKSKEAPRFEFSVKGVVDGVPLTGKPDCRFVHECGVHVILDWKVRGYCAKAGTSPSKNYRLCRDAYDASDQKPSRSNGLAHPGYVPHLHNGLEIHAGYLEDASQDWADQLSIYGWLLGEAPGDESVVCCIDEIVGKPAKSTDVLDKKPWLRVANHRSRVHGGYQLELLEETKRCWNAIQTGYIFTDLSRADNDNRCELLEETSKALPMDAWFNEVTRPVKAF